MDINNFNDYLIYKDGRVYSKKRNIFLKGWIDRKGYHLVDLNGNAVRVHRLVADNYIPNPNQYPCVDHIDRNKLNNNLENLRWVNNKINNDNKGFYKNNKLGHKNICIQKKYIRFKKTYNKKEYVKIFKSLTDALCYKYIFLLKIKSNIYK